MTSVVSCYALPLLLAAASSGSAVSKGPVISGVTGTEAWIAWETTAPEGRGDGCSNSGPMATVRLTAPDGRASSYEDSTCGRIHHVHLTHLHPGTAYSLALDQPWTSGGAAAGQFSTAPEDRADTFSFVVYGDNRDSDDPAEPYRSAHAAVSSAVLRYDPQAAFLLNAGDLALNTPGAGRDRGYAEFFDVERALLASRPIFAVVGHHETKDLSQFDSLVNARSFVPGAKHPYYGSFDWGRAHIVLLDAFEGPWLGDADGRGPGTSDEQLRWIDADLAAASRAGKIIFLIAHQGPYAHVAAGTKGHGGSLEEQRRLVPLMRRYRVYAIFAGHDHFYARGQEGCVNYFVCGAGGAPMQQPDPAAPGVRKAAAITSYLVVQLRHGQVTAAAKDTSGHVIDGPVSIAPPDPSSCEAHAEQR